MSPLPAGFTLLETVLAIGLAMVAMNGIVLLNTMNLRLVKSARQSNAATLSLQERIEQLRTAPWNDLTKASYLQTTIFKVDELHPLGAPRSAAPLGSSSESITLSAYPTADASTTLAVERLADGTTRVLSEGPSLGTQRLARLQVRVTWRGSDSRERVRETATIVSNGGVSGFNVPSMGAVSGTLPEEGAAPPEPEPDPGSEPPPAPEPEPEPEPAPAGNGNGNGNGGGKQGNVGGKPGKG
ncbi:MAG: hypothetical protein M3463_14300 [Verrucomicrobiota bacterium]|nr:hypothetical protein [Verrucomicrobiota bacterium]